MTRAMPYVRIIQVYKVFSAAHTRAFHYVFQKTDPNGGPQLVETTLGDIARQANMRQRTLRAAVQDLFNSLPQGHGDPVDITDMVRAGHNVYQSNLRGKLTPEQKYQKRVNASLVNRGCKPRSMPRLRTKNLDIIAELKRRRQKGEL
jgi:hypothetical protein